MPKRSIPTQKLVASTDWSVIVPHCPLFPVPAKNAFKKNDSPFPRLRPFAKHTMAAFASLPGHGFFEKLAARAETIDSLLCVGLDPHVSELGEAKNASGAKAFCLRLIEATSSVALAYKPNAAFFEAFGVSLYGFWAPGALTRMFRCQHCFAIGASMY